MAGQTHEDWGRGVATRSQLMTLGGQAPEDLKAQLRGELRRWAAAVGWSAPARERSRHERRALLACDLNAETLWLLQPDFGSGQRMIMSEQASGQYVPMHSEAADLDLMAWLRLLGWLDRAGRDELIRRWARAELSMRRSDITRRSSVDLSPRDVVLLCQDARRTTDLPGQWVSHPKHYHQAVLAGLIDSAMVRVRAGHRLSPDDLGGALICFADGQTPLKAGMNSWASFNVTLEPDPAHGGRIRTESEDADLPVAAGAIWPALASGALDRVERQALRSLPRAHPKEPHA